MTRLNGIYKNLLKGAGVEFYEGRRPGGGATHTLQSEEPLHQVREITNPWSIGSETHFPRTVFVRGRPGDLASSCVATPRTLWSWSCLESVPDASLPGVLAGSLRGGGGRRSCRQIPLAPPASSPGYAKIIDEHTVEIAGKRHTAKHICAVALAAITCWGILNGVTSVAILATSGCLSMCEVRGSEKPIHTLPFASAVLGRPRARVRTLVL